MTLKLGVNIDHVATLREARKENDPKLLDAANACIEAKADSITIHLREDRRHIQDQDVVDIKELDIPLNLEMAATDEMVTIARNISPDFVCLVPEKREELTTEGGLDVRTHQASLASHIKKLKAAGIVVSIFIDPDIEQIKIGKSCGADAIEIHTGTYARETGMEKDRLASQIAKSAEFATTLDLTVNAGHGLNYENVSKIVRIPEIKELNIGHSIIARSVFIGLKNAIIEMKSLMRRST